jgi:hypothetical protein
MKSTDLVVLRWMLNEYDWSSKDQTKEELIKEFSNRAQAAKVVKRK